MAPDHFDSLLVEEYVDLPQNRSSLKIRDQFTQRTKVFYNEVFERPSPRRFVSYDIDLNRCQKASIYRWYLANLRKTTILMLPWSKLSAAFCDIAIGPATLLIGIRETMKDYRYINTDYEDRRLIKVDIYERHFVANERHFTIIVTVKVRRQTERKDLKINRNLAEVAQLTNQKVDVLSVKICRVSEAIGKSRAKEGANEEYDCKLEELLLKAHYLYIAPLSGDNLIGQKFTRDRGYDFYQDPFTQPFGVGCWTDDKGLSGQKTFSIDKRQFSAEFESTNSSMGVSFVAYDGYAELLRIDRNGRKSIYDLGREQSYHIDEFSSVKEITSSVDITKNCIVLDGNDDLLLGLDPIERLFGLRSASQTSAVYLGQKVINHITYGVYETELKYLGEAKSESEPLTAYNLPILLESTLYKLPTVNTESTKRFFITYYIEEYPSNLDAAYAGNENVSSDSKVMKIPKYIELWEYNVKGNKRRLVNRVEFNQFSWSLDVQPDDDSDTRDSSQLFNIQSCAKERSVQLELRHRLGPDSDSRFFDKNLIIAAFKSYPELIKELLHEKLASLLDISRLNIVHLDVGWMQQSPKLLLEARIVELISGRANNRMLGYDNYGRALKALESHIVSYNHGRHSLYSCQLDSLSEQTKNSLMYCESLALCILINQQAIDDYIVNLDHSPHPKENDKNINQFDGNANDDEQTLIFSLPGYETNSRCEFHQFSWLGRPFREQDSIVSRVMDNKYRLGSTQFEINFKLYVHPDWKVVKYVGSNYGPEIKRLDTIGESFDFKSDKKWPLGAIRHTIRSENLSTNLDQNFNIVIRIPKNRRNDNLKYCQLACQLDAYCESFSVCLRSKSSTPVEQMFDCILSTFRITSDTIEQLRSLSSGKAFGNNLGISHGHFNYTFKYDTKCSIHPKDTMSLYRVKEILNDSNGDGDSQASSELSDQSSTTTPLTTTTSTAASTLYDSSDIISANSTSSEKPDQQSVPKTALIVTLEECAEMSHAASLGGRKIGSAFLYCPLESFCFANYEDKTQKLPTEASNQLCYLYTASHTQFYDKTPFARLSIDKSSQPHTTAAMDQQQLKPTSNKDKMMALKRLKEWNSVSRFFADLSLDKCSQLCDLHQTNCLAFDHCKLRNNIQLCFTFSIRSPFSKKSKRLPLLKLEEQYYSDKSNRTAKLVSDSHCTHYHPKDIIFEIKLEQVQPSLLIPGESPEPFNQRNETNKVEDTIINENQDKSVNKLEEKIKQAGIDPETAEKIQTKAAESENGFLVNLFFALFGALIGTLGLTHGEVAIVYLSDHWERLKARRFARNTEHRVSQLALSNNQEL